MCFLSHITLICSQLKKSSNITRMLTLQQLQLQEPKWFKLITITFEDAVKQTFRENLLVISHRWEFHDDEGKEADHPDKDGEQLKYIVHFLNSPKGANIEYVWIECVCRGANSDPLHFAALLTSDFDPWFEQLLLHRSEPTPRGVARRL